MIDVMHLIGGTIGEHLMKLLKGERLQKKVKQPDSSKSKTTLTNQRTKRKAPVPVPKQRKPVQKKKKVVSAKSNISESDSSEDDSSGDDDEAQSGADDDEVQSGADESELDEYADAPVESLLPDDVKDDEKASLIEEIEKERKWILKKKQQDECDDVYSRMRAPTGIARTSTAPFKRRGQMTASNWLYFCRCYGKYFLRSAYVSRNNTDSSTQQRFSIICNLFDIFNLMTAHVFTPSMITYLDRKINQFLLDWYTYAPVSEHDIVFHIMKHVPIQIERYGPVHSYWMFTYESFFKHLGALMKLVSNPEANLMLVWVHSFAVNVNESKDYFDNINNIYVDHLDFPEASSGVCCNIDVKQMEYLLERMNQTYYDLKKDLKTYKVMLLNILNQLHGKVEDLQQKKLKIVVMHVKHVIPVFVCGDLIQHHMSRSWKIGFMVKYFIFLLMN